MHNIILQINKDLVSESKCIRKLSMIRNDVKVYETKYEDLDKYKDLLLEGAIPVGSVEFTKYCMKLANINIPKFDCYDSILPTFFYGRNINTLIKFGDSLNFIYNLPRFIKPKQTKLFTGFVYYGDNYLYYNEHDVEQLNKLKQVPDNTLLYGSDVINIKAEWRCYINKGKLVSVCQYDDSEEDLIPDNNFINKCLEKLGNRTLALDIGLLDIGEYVVIELNDAWAIGKYSGISDNDYFDFIVTRWEEIYMKRKNNIIEHRYFNLPLLRYNFIYVCENCGKEINNNTDVKYTREIVLIKYLPDCSEPRAYDENLLTEDIQILYYPVCKACGYDYLYLLDKNPTRVDYDIVEEYNYNSSFYMNNLYI